MEKHTDRAGSTEDMSTQVRNSPPTQTGLRDSGKVPIICGTVETRVDIRNNRIGNAFIAAFEQVVSENVALVGRSWVRTLDRLR
jgi:hypothetical protein